MGSQNGLHPQPDGASTCCLVISSKLCLTLLLRSCSEPHARVAPRMSDRTSSSATLVNDLFECRAHAEGVHCSRWHVSTWWRLAVVLLLCSRPSLEFNSPRPWGCLHYLLLLFGVNIILGDTSASRLQSQAPDARMLWGNHPSGHLLVPPTCAIRAHPSVLCGLHAIECGTADQLHLYLLHPAHRSKPCSAKTPSQEAYLRLSGQTELRCSRWHTNVAWVNSASQRKLDANEMSETSSVRHPSLKRSVCQLLLFFVFGGPKCQRLEPSLGCSTARLGSRVGCGLVLGWMWGWLPNGLGVVCTVGLGMV